MASGSTLDVLLPEGGQPPASAAAQLNTRNAINTIDFDAATDETMVWGGVLSSAYAGGGLTCVVIWAAATATTGNVVWNIKVWRVQDDVDDIDSDGYAAVQAVTAGAASVSGEPSYDNITFTSGAQMDSLAAGEYFRIALVRDADNASDTMAGDAQLLAIHVKET